MPFAGGSDSSRIRCAQVGSACSAVLCLAFPFAPSAAAAALCMAALKLALCYSGAGFSSNYYEIGGQQTALISGVGPSPTPPDTIWLNSCSRGL